MILYFVAVRELMVSDPKGYVHPEYGAPRQPRVALIYAFYI